MYSPPSSHPLTVFLLKNGCHINFALNPLFAMFLIVRFTCCTVIHFLWHALQLSVVGWAWPSAIKAHYKGVAEGKPGTVSPKFGLGWISLGQLWQPSERQQVVVHHRSTFNKTANASRKINLETWSNWSKIGLLPGVINGALQVRQFTLPQMRDRDSVVAKLLGVGEFRSIHRIQQRLQSAHAPMWNMIFWGPVYQCATNVGQEFRYYGHWDSLNYFPWVWKVFLRRTCLICTEKSLNE